MLSLFASHPLKVEQVFLKGLSGLRLLALIHDVWILFVATALVILAAMSLPITQTHPAEIYTATAPPNQDHLTPPEEFNHVF